MRGFTATPGHLVCGRDAKSYRRENSFQTPKARGKIYASQIQEAVRNTCKAWASRESVAYRFLPGDFSTVPRENKYISVFRRQKKKKNRSLREGNSGSVFREGGTRARLSDQRSAGYNCMYIFTYTHAHTHILYFIKYLQYNL